MMEQYIILIFFKKSFFEKKFLINRFVNHEPDPRLR